MNQLETLPAQADASDGLFPGFPTLDLGKLFQAILKRLWLAVSIAMVFVILAIAYVLCAKKFYESNALIYIESTNSDGVFNGLKGASQKSYESLDSLKSIAAGLTSGAVILRVDKKLGLRDDPTFIKPSRKGPHSDAEIVKYLGKRLRSELVKGERNIYLRVEDSDPERARDIAANLISEFRLMLLEQTARVAEQTRETLIEKSKAQGKRVDQAELELQQFREKYPDMPLDEESGALSQKYLDLQEILNRVKDEAHRLKAEYEQYLQVKSDPERILEIGTYAGLESIQKLLLARDSKVAEFYKIQKQFTPKSSTYRAFAADVEGLNRQVAAAALSIGESIEKRYRSAVERAKSAEAQLKEQASENLKAEGIRREFRTLKRAREAALATYDRLLERINDSNATRNVDETVIHTFTPPLVNNKPVKPKKTLTVFLAGIFGGFVGVAVILGMGLLDKTLTTRQQVEATLGLSVLAEIPRAFGDQNWDLKESIMVSKDPNSLVSEGFRALRTSLSSLTPRSVMFTSPTAGEGKSFCAANLAVLQAQYGYRTLIVDADVRNPQMANLFTIPKLAQDSEEEGLIVQNSCQETVIPNLYLMSLGQFVPGSDKAMSGDHFAAMLWESYSSFDCVIIDTSPLCLVSDGLNFSRYADAVMLVVQADSTEAGPALEALKELRRMRAPVAGCVLNGVTRVDQKRADYVSRTAPAGSLQTAQTPA